MQSKILYNGDKMKISTCIIAKNEEEVVERILKCVAKFSDEIIFVDTGSRDKTLNIAQKYTEKIYQFKWQNDFSMARNFAFSKATCEYLAWFDADDIITDQNCNEILKIKQIKNPSDTYMFKYLCGFTSEDKPSLTFYRERLMRNCAYAKFVGAVHEVVIPFGKTEYLAVEVEHRKIKSGNSKRNLKIYNKISKEQPLCSRDMYYYAKEYYYNGYYKSAIKLLNKYLKASGGYAPDIKDAYLTLYGCAISLNLKNPLKYLLKCLEFCALDGEVLCKLGDEFYRLKDYKKSIDFYKIALSIDCTQIKFGFVRQEYYYVYPLLQLVKTCYQIGWVDQALFFHKKCLERYPCDERVVYNTIFFEKVGLK